MSGVNQPLTAATDRATGRKHCGQCGAFTLLEGGKILVTGLHSRRWICAGCVERRANRTPSRNLR